MLTYARPRSLTCAVLALSGLFCQSAWAQATDVSNLLAQYVPVQDQLCNYCDDYTVGKVPAGHLATLYQPGIGYPDPVFVASAPIQGKRVNPVHR